MFLLWPDCIRHDDVMLFLRDAAWYMFKAGKSIATLYLNMVHITCLAHNVHRVTEKIRGQYAKVKQIVSKCPTRV